MSYRRSGLGAATSAGTITSLSARDAQTALFTRGFNVGPSGIDGNFGTASQTAMRQAIEFALVAPTPSNAFTVSPGGRDVQVQTPLWSAVLALPTSRAAVYAPGAATSTTRAPSTPTTGAAVPVTPGTMTMEAAGAGAPSWLVPALVVGGVVVVGSAGIVAYSRRKVARNSRRKRRVRRNGAVAETILKQLGGTGRLAAMIDAKDFVDIGNGVQFRFGWSGGRGYASPNTNKIVIKLDPNDTYTVEFWWIRGTKMKKVASESGVYADQLRPIIESQIGMRLALNRRRAA